MVVKQSGLSIPSDDKVITTEKFFGILVGALYASDFCGQTTVGDLHLMAEVYQDMQSEMDLKAMYGELGLVTRLLTNYLKANPRKHSGSNRLISVEFIFEDAHSRSKKLKAKAIKLVAVNREKGEVEEIDNISPTLSRYCLHYLFGDQQ